MQIQKCLLFLLAARDATQQTWERIVFGILRPVRELCPCLRLVWANMMPTRWFEPFWYCAGRFIKPVAACLLFLIHSLIRNIVCLLCSWAYLSCHVTRMQWLKQKCKASALLFQNGETAATLPTAALPGCGFWLYKRET